MKRYCVCAAWLIAVVSPPEDGGTWAPLCVGEPTGAAPLGGVRAYTCVCFRAVKEDIRSRVFD